jgi:hypothetical protein
MTILHFSSSGLNPWIIFASIQRMSALPLLRLVKKRYFPSKDKLGQISSKGEFTAGPIFFAGIHSPSFVLKEM